MLSWLVNFGKKKMDAINQKVDEMIPDFDEVRTESASDVRRIRVCSSCFDVNIKTEETSDVKARLHGYTSKNSNIIFKAVLEEGELIVTVETNNVFIGSLELDLILPDDKEFGKIVVETTTGNFVVEDKLRTKLLNVCTSSGDVEIAQLYSADGITIKTSTGDVDISENVRSEFIDVKTSSGDIVVEDVKAKRKICLESTTGDIDVKYGISSNIIEIETKSGDVSFCRDATSFDCESKTAKEWINIRTSTGDICIDDGISAPKISIETMSGDVSISKQASFDGVEVETSTGDIEIEGSFADADVESHSGSVDLEVYAKSKISINATTTTGDVDIKLHNVGELRLIPKTKTGDISSSYNSSRGDYTAEINVTTASGDIEIS